MGGQGVPANGNQPFQPGQAGGPQGIGNGFGLFRQPQQRTTATFTPVNIPAQLHQLEHQLMREVNTLRLQADQLYLVRSLQGELARLRIQQAQANLNPGSTAPINYQQRPPASVPQLAQLPSSPQVFTTNQQQQSLSSGHADLPPGMTLPEGWTVLPLQRVTHNNLPALNALNVAQAPTVPPSAAGPTTTQASSSDPIPPTLSDQLPSAAQNNNQHVTASGPGLAPSTNNTTLSPPSKTAPAQPESSNSGPLEGSSQPSSAPTVPNWGPASVPQNHVDQVEPSQGVMNGTAKPPSGGDEAEAAAAERREAKGKARAVTIEDEIDDVD